MHNSNVLALYGGTPVYAGSWPAEHRVDAKDEEILLCTLRSTNWTAGGMTSAFERGFANFCGARHCLLVENGTAALKIALQAAGIRPGDEVLIPGITWPSVAAAVLDCHAAPVPIDIELDTFGITADAVEAAIQDRTRAVVPTHLFCSQTDMVAIQKLAKQRGLVLVEDCAHVPGARRFGSTLGTFGHVGVFSFNQKKLLSCGEGGCLITNDADLFERAVSLRHFDATPGGLVPGTHLASEFQAAILIGQMRKLPETLAIMEERGERLRSLLHQIEDIEPLARLPGTNLQTFYNFCFRVRGGTDITFFRQALAAELSLKISGAYTPLADVPTLNTSADPRFRELGRHLRTTLPNCVTAHYGEAVRFRHSALMAGEDAIEAIANAVEKVHRIGDSTARGSRIE